MQEHHPMFVRIWRFLVRPEKANDFLSAYGPTGPWATLFHRVAGYLGTDLLRSATEPNTYFTVDRWESAEAWAAFLRAWGDDYAALDRRCEMLTETEAELGEFRRV
jgi:heme-degrading monooxygenase HmoA